MAKQLPRPGDIYFQKAMILVNEPGAGKQKLLQLFISDESGGLEGEITKERLVAVFEHNFQEQFAPTEQDNIFIRAVKIKDCVPQANEITFYRLDTEGKRIMPIYTQKEKLDTFLKTYFKSKT